MRRILRVLKFIGIWLGAFLAMILLTALLFPSNESGQSSTPIIMFGFITVLPFIIASKIVPVPIFQSKFGRKICHILCGFLLWFFLMLCLLQLDKTFALSKKWDWFAVVAFLLPVICTVFFFTKFALLKKIFKVMKSAGTKATKATRDPPPPPRRDTLPPTPPAPPLPPIRRHGRYLMSRVDAMTGNEFEHFIAELLKKLGYINVKVTPSSGDQGVDVLAEKDGIRYAIQCKNYSSPLGNTPVQEVAAGKDFYGCHVGVVVTNSTFTAGGKELAASVRVLLWDRETLKAMMEAASD